MATEQKILDISFEAAEDLSNDQYRFVTLDTTSEKVRRPDSDGEYSIGILQNAPTAGEAAVVRIIGISKLQVNAALAVGTYVKPEYVDAADAGKGADAGGNYARGKLLEASSAEDDLVSCLLVDGKSAYKAVTVTVSAGATSGSSAADSALTGGEVLGVYPAGNQDQFIDNVALNADGSITVTLAAAATADNTFKVVVAKP